MDNLLAFQIAFLWGVLVWAFLIVYAFRRGRRAAAMFQAAGLLAFLVTAFLVYPDLLASPD